MFCAKQTGASTSPSAFLDFPLDGRKEFIGSVGRGGGHWKLVLDSSNSKETVRIRKRTQGSAFLDVL